MYEGGLVPKVGAIAQLFRDVCEVYPLNNRNTLTKRTQLYLG